MPGLGPQQDDHKQQQHRHHQQRQQQSGAAGPTPSSGLSHSHGSRGHELLPLSQRLSDTRRELGRRQRLLQASTLLSVKWCFMKRLTVWVVFVQYCSSA